MNLKDLTYSFFAAFLSVVILISASGFTADLHFCQGEFKSYSLIGKAKSCHDNSKADNQIQCPHHQNLSQEEEDAKNCCENEIRHFQSDQDQIIQNLSTSVDIPVQVFNPFPALYELTHFNLDEDYTSTDFFYKPPLIDKDIPVLIQSFLL